MPEFDVIVSSVRDRADLLDQTLRSMLAHLDFVPARIIVHEDTREQAAATDLPPTPRILSAIEEGWQVPIVLLERNPGMGLGQACVRLLREAQSEFVFYTQEDFDFVRRVPVSRCMRIMAENGLHHVRFNKRKTMRVKGEHRPLHEQFHKLEVPFGDEVLCSSDHWYFQASLWRRDLALRGFEAVVPTGNRVERVEAAFNRWLNRHLGGNVTVSAPEDRAHKIRTFIWGPIGEPAFILHTGSDRRTQGWETA